MTQVMSDRLLQLCREQFGDVPEHYLKEAIPIEDMCLIPNWGLSSETIEQMQRVADGDRDSGGVGFIKYYAKSTSSRFSQSLNELAEFFINQGTHYEVIRSIKNKKNIEFILRLVFEFAWTFYSKEFNQKIQEGEKQRRTLTQEDFSLYWQGFEFENFWIKRIEVEAFKKWFEENWYTVLPKHKETLETLGGCLKAKLFDNSEQIIFAYTPAEDEHLHFTLWVIIGNHCIIVLNQYHLL